MKTRRTKTIGRRMMASLLAVVMLLGTLWVPAGAAPSSAQPDGYVTDNLVFWLDANTNTGTGYDANATQWVNLANTDEKVDVSGFDWGTDSYGNHYLDMDGGYIKLPDTVRQALAGQNFTIEFLMDDYVSDPAPKIRNIMAATGDDAWLEAQKGSPTGTVNDNFVLFMNEGGTGGNDRWFCFRTCYGPNWSYIFPSNTKYCTGPYAGTKGMTNTITFDHDGSSYWYQGGSQVGTTTNNGNTIGLDGFKVNGTWQTERKPQIIFGTNTDTLSNREEFVAKVKAIRIYTDSLTAAEAKQNAEVDAERYYTNPYMTQNYVQEDLVLWLDADNNTGAGFDANATKWVNLANPSQTVDVSKFSWGTDSLHDANYLDLKNGWIILPDEVRQAIGSEKFTIEFLLDGYDGAPNSKIRNIMNATGDDAWLASLSGAVATPNDNFVIFMNQSGGGNNGKFCFRTCYTNGSTWTKVNDGRDYAKVVGNDINAVTNSVTFKSGGNTIWYLDGTPAAEGDTTNTTKLIDLNGFRTSPGDASTWQTERKPQITFGTDNNVIASRPAFAAKVKAIRVYKDELTAAEVAQNAAADQERYYTLATENNVPEGYVESGLVLFLDALNNTGTGTHDDAAARWVNLANTDQSVALPTGTAGSASWAGSYLDMSGYIKLPDEVRQAIASGQFTIEFLMDDYSGTTVDSANYRNIFALTGSDNWITSSTSKGGTPNDNFVIYQNNGTTDVLFKVNGSDYADGNGYKRANVKAASIDGKTNAIVLDTASVATNSKWYQSGTLVSTSRATYSAPDVASYTGAAAGEVPQVVFGAVIDRVSAREFSANVKAIRVYNRPLSAFELAQNTAADESRYVDADKLVKAAKDSWNEVLVGNPSATTAAKLETYAAGKMTELAAENLTVKVTDNKDGTFTFTYDAKYAVAGFTPISYTLYVDSDYEVDFSTMTEAEQAEFLKDTYAHELGSKMSLAFTDGALVYDVTNTARPVSGLYLPVYYSGDEFVWEMEIAYDRDTGSTWAGQLFAVKDVETPQYTCTFNIAGETGTAAYEFCKRTKPDLWGGHVTTTLSAANFGEGKLDASKFNATYSAKEDTTYTLKYVVKDGVAFGFIDDVLVVEASNLDSDLSGIFGINSAGVTLKVKSIKISTDTSGEQVFSAVGHYDVDIYEPETAITIAPSVMQMADAETYDVYDETVRPASIIFDVKAENGVLNAYDGDTKLGAFSTLYEANYGKAIVGVRIPDEAAAELLVEYSQATKNENLWAFSADGALLKAINGSCPLIRGVVEISAADLAGIVDNDTVRTAVYDKVYGYGHRTVVIPAEAATEAVVRELQSMKLAVIIEGYELSVAEIYDMVAAGPAAILTDDYAAVIDMLERFEDYTLVRPSLVVGHRGDRTYPDNSIESITSAAKSGAGAAELDVIATLDGYLVMSHDNDNYEAVDYRNGTWAGVAITNAYWKKANAEAAGRPNDYFEGRLYHTSTSQTPVEYATLDGLFDATGAQYPALTYHIEVKDYNDDTRPGKSGKIVVNLIDELLRSEKYSFLRGRCDILCFGTAINYPSTEKGYAVHNQNSNTVTDNMANTIYTYERFYRPINSLLEPGTNVVTIPTLEIFKHYGMICCPWTYNNGGLYQAYTMGYHGFTTDYPHVSDGIYWSLEVTVDPDTGAVTANTYKLADHLKTTPIDVSDKIEIVTVSGAPAVVDGKVFGIEGDAVAARLKVDVSASSGSQKWFYLYSPSTAPAAAAVAGIEVTADPAKTEYDFGTTALDLTGGKITVTYNTGATEEMDITAEMVTFNPDKIGDQIITVTYEGFSDTFIITVNPEEIIPAVVGVEVTAAPAKTEYDFGTTALDLTGGKITATYNTGTTAEVDITADMISGFDPAKAGDQVITVTYEGCKSFFVITLKPEVVDPSVVGIEVTAAPAKTEYANGEELDLAGGKVTVTYDDGSTTEVELNASMVSGYVPTKAGDQVVTVSYQGFKSFFVVTVAAPVADPEVESISVIAPEITEYEQGTALDLTGGKITVTYDDGSTAEVDLTADMVSGFNPEKTGEQVVTVAYAGCETFFVVTVNAPPAPPAPKPNPVIYYAVKVKAADNGTVTASAVESKGGKIITLTAKPAAGYQLASLTITDNKGNNIPWSVEDDEILFVMPAGAVTVEPVFTLSGSPAVDSDAFIDVEDDDWFAAAVDFVAANGLMTGTSPITFAPDVDTSRAMIVTILYSLEGKPAVTGENAFSDVNDGDWYADPVNWAAANGIVSGYGNGKFGPNDAITREQLAAILRTYADYKGWDVTGAADLTAFADADKISPWAETALAWAVENGLISGKGNGILDPTGTAIRAEVAQVLKNFVEQF